MQQAEQNHTGISGRSSDFRITLFMRLPINCLLFSEVDSDVMHDSSPVTAAGPSSIFTKFPFMSFYGHLKFIFIFNGCSWCCQPIRMKLHSILYETISAIHYRVQFNIVPSEKGSSGWIPNDPFGHKKMFEMIK